MTRRLLTAMWRTALAGAMLLLGGAAPAGALSAGGRMVLADQVLGPAGVVPQPAAAYDATLDRYLVAWLQSEPQTSTVNVWARFVTADGVADAPPFLAATVGTGIEQRHARTITLTYDALRREYLLLIAGLRNASVPQGTELYAQWLDDQGEQIGTTTSISRASEGAASQPVVTADPARDRFVVAYAVDRPSLPVPTIAVQQLRRGDIQPPVLPFGEQRLGDPALTVAPADGTVLVAGVSDDGTTIQTAALDAALEPKPGSGEAWSASSPLTAAPVLAWHDERGGAALAWGESGGARLATLGTAGTVGTPQHVDTAGTPAAVALVAEHREQRWLLAARSDAGELVLSELGADAPVAGPLTLGITADGEPSPLTDATTTLSMALDTTRQWLLLPYGAALGSGRTLLGRIVAASPPTPPSGTETATGTPASSRCLAAATLFVVAAGSVCGPAALPAFSVAPVTRRSRKAWLGVSVEPTTHKQRVRIECVTGCKRLRRVLSARGSRRATLLMLGAWRAPAGATIEVRVEQSARTTRYRRFIVGKRYPFLTPTASSGCRLATGVNARC
ncbi:MAG: hypothetical protein QM679_07100 [Patulibacter sp.]